MSSKFRAFYLEAWAVATIGFIGSFVVPRTHPAAELSRSAAVTAAQSSARVYVLPDTSAVSLSVGMLDVGRVNAKLLATPDYGLLPVEETSTDFWGTAQGLSEQLSSLNVPALELPLLGD